LGRHEPTQAPGEEGALGTQGIARRVGRCPCTLTNCGRLLVSRPIDTQRARASAQALGSTLSVRLSH